MRTSSRRVLVLSFVGLALALAGCGTSESNTLGPANSAGPGPGRAPDPNDPVTRSPTQTVGGSSGSATLGGILECASEGVNAVVDGQQTCLKKGQVCAASKDPQYRRVNLTCQGGRLRNNYIHE